MNRYLNTAPEVEAAIVNGTWFVIVTQAQQEVVAATSLFARGLCFYYPTFPKMIGGNYNKRRPVRRPMLPGYIFASFDPNENRWKSIAGLPGIRRIIMADERPIPVPEAALQFIRQREKELQIDSRSRKRWPMPAKTGDFVQITDHASFGGLFGRVIQLLAERGKLVLEIDLGVRVQKIEISAHQIRAV